MKVKKKGIFPGYDVIGVILSFLNSSDDFLSFSIISKGFHEYVEYQNPFCARNIEFTPFKMPSIPKTYVYCLFYPNIIRLLSKNAKDMGDYEYVVEQDCELYIDGEYTLESTSKSTDGRFFKVKVDTELFPNFEKLTIEHDNIGRVHLEVNDFSFFQRLKYLQIPERTYFFYHESNKGRNIGNVLRIFDFHPSTDEVDVEEFHEWNQNFNMEIFRSVGEVFFQSFREKVSKNYKSEVWSCGKELEGSNRRIGETKISSLIQQGNSLPNLKSSIFKNLEELAISQDFLTSLQFSFLSLGKFPSLPKLRKLWIFEDETECDSKEGNLSLGDRPLEESFLKNVVLSDINTSKLELLEITGNSDLGYPFDIEDHLQKFSKTLTKLKIDYEGKITLENLEQLRHCSLFSPIFLPKSFRNCKKLRTLFIARGRNIDVLNEEVCELSELSHLRLSGKPYIGGEFLKKSTNLRRLKITLYKSDLKSIDHLKSSLSRLFIVLKVKKGEREENNDETPIDFLDQFIGLMDLRIDTIPRNDFLKDKSEDFNIFYSIKHLLSLKVTNLEISRIFQDNWNILRELTVSNVMKSSLFCMKSPRQSSFQLRNLQYLCLDRCIRLKIKNPYECSIFFRVVPNLEHLAIRECPGIKMILDYQKIHQKEAKPPSILKKLRVLEIHGNQSFALTYNTLGKVKKTISYCTEQGDSFEGTRLSIERVHVTGLYLENRSKYRKIRNLLNTIDCVKKFSMDARLMKL